MGIRSNPPHDQVCFRRRRRDGDTFRELNVSGTGKLTKDEAMNSAFIRNRVAAPFDEADVNHSGYVTWEEFQVALAKRRAYVR